MTHAWRGMVLAMAGTRAQCTRPLCKSCTRLQIQHEHYACIVELSAVFTRLCAAVTDTAPVGWPADHNSQLLTCTSLRSVTVNATTSSYCHSASRMMH